MNRVNQDVFNRVPRAQMRQTSLESFATVGMDFESSWSKIVDFHRSGSSAVTKVERYGSLGYVPYYSSRTSLESLEPYLKSDDRVIQLGHWVSSSKVDHVVYVPWPQDNTAVLHLHQVDGPSLPVDPCFEYVVVPEAFASVYPIDGIGPMVPLTQILDPDIVWQKAQSNHVTLPASLTLIRRRPTKCAQIWSVHVAGPHLDEHRITSQNFERSIMNWPDRPCFPKCSKPIVTTPLGSRQRARLDGLKWNPFIAPSYPELILQIEQFV